MAPRSMQQENRALSSCLLALAQEWLCSDSPGVFLVKAHHESMAEYEYLRVSKLVLVLTIREYSGKGLPRLRGDW